MIIVTGEVRFGVGEVERLREALADNIAATRAESGCDHYAYSIDIADPNLVHVSERWADLQAVEAHFATPHMARLNALLAKAKIEALSVKAYDATFLKTLMGG